ncbi:hypothetical protein [Eikenella halliae]|uniref:hypothetical protein n=1 Tax=Eikenella halliae TaxID=1795832 RepID=UPI003608BF4C
MAQQIVLYAVIRGRADRQPREAWEKVSGSFKTQGYLKNEEGCLFQVAFYPIRIEDERKPGEAAGSMHIRQGGARSISAISQQGYLKPKRPSPPCPAHQKSCLQPQWASPAVITKIFR